MPSESDWLAQCARFESGQDHEWPAIAWVIRNRVESPQFPDTYEAVILQPWQFSGYNRWRGMDPATIYGQAQQTYASDRRSQVLRAVVAVKGASRSEAPFGRQVLHYYSPVSMSPPGSVPDWDWRILRPFTLLGIDPWRFVYAETVRRGHPLAGEPRRYEIGDR